MDNEELLKMQFTSCRDFASSSPLFPASLSPAMWLHLQALDLQASSGPCTLAPPPPAETEQRAIWRAWCQLGSMSDNEAREAFIKLVLQACEAVEAEQDTMQFLSRLQELEEVGMESYVKGTSTEGRGEGLGGRMGAKRRGDMGEEEEKGKSRLASDLKSGLSGLREELENLNTNAREDVRHMGMAIQADVTIEERAMDARHQRAQVEELRYEVQTALKQLDSDLYASLSRRKWSYDHIENQCDELLARCETCANTYKNQISLTSPSILSRMASYSTLLVLPVTAAMTYWYWKKTRRKLIIR